MNFDASRLARLAGLPVGESQTLTEASNRSYHDKDNSDEVQFRHGGENQLAEQSGPDPAEVQELGTAIKKLVADRQQVEEMMAQFDAILNADEADRTAAMEQSGVNAGDFEQFMMLKRALDNLDSVLGTPSASPQNEVVEIDEAMLQNEIKKMRQERIEENALRSVVRTEIGSILEDLKNSTKDTKQESGDFNGITKGFPGPGFR